LALGSIGARTNWIGVANHHHTAAIALRDMRRSASGVRSEIGSILLAGTVELAGHRPSAKSRIGAFKGAAAGRLYHNAIKL
jgi:hypothetical protein